MLSRTEYSGLKGKCVGLQAHLYPTQISHSNPRITVLVRDGCGIHELSFAGQPARHGQRAEAAQMCSQHMKINFYWPLSHAAVIDREPIGSKRPPFYSSA